MQLLTKTCVNHYSPPRQLLDLKQITIFPLSKYYEILYKTLYTPVCNHCEIPYKPFSNPCAITRESDTNHYLSLNQLLRNPKPIAVYSLGNSCEILYKSLSTPCVIMKKPHINRYRPLKQILGDAV